MKLNLGCGSDRRQGFLNVDLQGSDFDYDIERTPWPWADGSMHEILALFVLEHINRLDAVWFEIHRVLRVGGEITIEVVDGKSYDPFHHSTWNRSSIRYLTNGYIGRFRLIQGPTYKSIPSGFPNWHIRHYLGTDPPAIRGAHRSMRFTLEKVSP